MDTVLLLLAPILLLLAVGGFYDLRRRRSGHRSGDLAGGIDRNRHEARLRRDDQPDGGGWGT